MVPAMTGIPVISTSLKYPSLLSLVPSVSQGELRVIGKVLIEFM